MCVCVDSPHTHTDPALLLILARGVIEWATRASVIVFSAASSTSGNPDGGLTHPSNVVRLVDALWDG